MLLQRLEENGIHRRFALDIASVINGVRQRGLIHVHDSKAFHVKRLMSEANLQIIAQRKLIGSKDPNSREGILSDFTPAADPKSWWSEIWYEHKDRTSGIDQITLYANTGECLGYPQCCVNAMAHTTSLATFYQNYLTDDTPRFWEINRLATLFSEVLLIPDFFPCSLSCQHAQKFAQPFISLSRQLMGDEDHTNWVKTCKQIFFTYKSSLFAAKEHNIKKGILCVHKSDLRQISISEIARINAPKPHLQVLNFAHLANNINLNQVIIIDGDNEFKLGTKKYDGKV